MPDDRPAPAPAQPEETLMRDRLAVERTVLANERTLLAYVRTALALVVVGASAIRFFSDRPTNAAGVVFIIAGVALFIIGVSRFRSVRAALLPAHRAASSRGV